MTACGLMMPLPPTYRNKSRCHATMSICFHQAARHPGSGPLLISTMIAHHFGGKSTVPTINMLSLDIKLTMSMDDLAFKSRCTVDDLSSKCADREDHRRCMYRQVGGAVASIPKARNWRVRAGIPAESTRCWSPRLAFAPVRVSGAAVPSPPPLNRQLAAREHSRPCRICPLSDRERPG